MKESKQKSSSNGHLSTNGNTSEILEKPSAQGKERAKKLKMTSDRFKYSTMSENAEKGMEKIQKKDRTYFSNSSDWFKSKYAWTNTCEVLLKNCPQEIDTVEYDQVSEQDFYERFQKPGKACLIKNMYSQSHIDKYWSFQALYDRYKEAIFKCGEDDDGKKLKIHLKYYMEYLICNRDDSPLYLFESSIEDNKDAKTMIHKYNVPKYFSEDFFQFVGEKKRPPYRWFLMGPERSGTTVHLDPLFTDAWNTSFQGYKRWVLFPQHIPKAIVKGKQYKPKGEDDEAINYFAKMLPEIIKNEGREMLGIQEFIQGPGETVYIPGGMWHAVLNLSDTVAVTQNVMTSSNLENVWRSTRQERKRFAAFALKKFKKQKPELAEKIEKLNNKDQWVMYDVEKKINDKRKACNNDLKKFAEDEFIQYQWLQKKRKYSTDSSASSSSSSSSEYDSSSQSDSSSSSSSSNGSSSSNSDSSK